MHKRERLRQIRGNATRDDGGGWEMLNTSRDWNKYTSAHMEVVDQLML